MRATDFLIMFAIGAVTSLIGDGSHVDAGVTVYEHESIPSIWNSDIWFPVLVGLGTASLGALRLRLAPPSLGFDLRHAAGSVAAVLAIYALTSIVVDEPELAAAVLCYGAAVVVLCWLAESWADVACAVVAAIVGPLFEIGVVAFDVTEYADIADPLAGIPFWLPALYIAAGVAAARIAGWLALRHAA